MLQERQRNTFHHPVSLMDVVFLLDMPLMSVIILNNVVEVMTDRVIGCLNLLSDDALCIMQCGVVQCGHT